MYVNKVYILGNALRVFFGITYEKSAEKRRVPPVDHMSRRFLCVTACERLKNQT